MKEWIADSVCSGMRVDRYLQRMLPSAGAGFLQKMLRKKNITVNGKRALGSDRLAEGDRICVFFSDETLAAFSAPRKDPVPPKDTSDRALRIPVDILYEDEEIAAVNKPAGILTQKAALGDVSLNDAWLSFLIRRRGYTKEMLSFFTPAAANRLDRNTSGIVLMGKTLGGQQKLSAWLAGTDPDGGITKVYRAVVSGDVRGLPERRKQEDPAADGLFVLNSERDLSSLPKDLLSPAQRAALGTVLSESAPWILAAHYLCKDRETNVSGILPRPSAGAVPVRTAVHPRQVRDGKTDADLLLLTGKSHQLRAHLAWLGYPVWGDPKYAPAAVRRGAGRQLLHAFRAKLPGIGWIEAPLPEDFPSWTKPADPKQG